MSTRREFIARGRSAQEVGEELGVDFLLYQEIDDMVSAARGAGSPDTSFCKACFTGDYPTGDVTPRMLAVIEGERLASGSV